MSPEIIFRAADSIKSKMLPQRGLKGKLKREVESCLDYFDEAKRGGPISSIHANGLTIGKLEDGSGYYVEIEEYRIPGEIDYVRFTYKDRIMVQGRRVTMQHTDKTEASFRQSLNRGEVEKIICMIQNITVPYKEVVEIRKTKQEARRAKAESLITKARGRLPAKFKMR